MKYWVAFLSTWLGISSYAYSALPSARLNSETTAFVELFSGRIAVLPSPDLERLAASPVGQLLEQSDWAAHIARLTPAQYADTNFFNGRRFPLALHLGFESYYQTVKRARDGDDALRHYLASGGTLFLLTSGPYPMYYNEAGKPVNGAAQLGLSIGAGGFDAPPPNLNLRFQVHTNQAFIRWPQAELRFPGPQEADQRWRPARASAQPGTRYTPLLTLLDDRGGNHGEGGTLIEFLEGPYKGARLVYVWCSLLADESVRTTVLNDGFRSVLAPLPPPPSQLACRRATGTFAPDRVLTEAFWRNASGARFKRLGSDLHPPARATRLYTRWDSHNLYLRAVCENATADDTVFFWLAPNPTDKAQRLCVGLNRNGELLFPDGRKEAADCWHKTQGTESAWTAFLAIPWKYLPGCASAPRWGSELPLQAARVFNPGSTSLPETNVWSSTESVGASNGFGMLTCTTDPLADDFEGRESLVLGEADWRLEGGSWKLDGGSLVGENCVADTFEFKGAARGDHNWRDYTFSVRFKIERRGSDWRDGPWFGLRHRPDGDGYYLTFTARDCQLHKVIYGVSTSDANCLARGAFKPDDQWHRLRVAARANFIQAWLDDQPLLQVKDNAHLFLPSIRSGGITLGARKSSQSQGQTVIRFDDLIVEPFEQKP